MDLSNPPLTSVDTAEKTAPKAASSEPAKHGQGQSPDKSVDLTLAGLEVPKGTVTMKPGEEVELDEISTHRCLCLELRYFCSSYLDYNIMAYDNSGSHLWNSTYSNT